MMQRKVLVAYNLVWIAIALTGYSLMLLDKALMVKVMIIITNGMIIIFYFLEKKYAGFFLLMQEDASETKYRKSRLKGIDTGTTVERIRELMEIEQIYRDDVMSLQKLSAILQITPHQLSEILNNEMKMNFKTLINSYRIEAAKKKLAQKNDSTILELAFECGFSSKSVFNRTFSKIVGITPTEFRTKYKETGLSLYTGTTRPE